LKRNRTEQLIDILEQCKNGEGLKITHVSHKANVDGKTAVSALTFLTSKDLLEKLYFEKAKRPVYRTTKDGRWLVRLYREVEKALAIEGRIS